MLGRTLDADLGKEPGDLARPPLVARAEQLRDCRDQEHPDDSGVDEERARHPIPGPLRKTSGPSAKAAKTAVTMAADAKMTREVPSTPSVMAPETWPVQVHRSRMRLTRIT